MNGNLLCRDAVIRRTLVCLRYLYRRSLSLSLSVVSSVVALSADVEGWEYLGGGAGGRGRSSAAACPEEAGVRWSGDWTRHYRELSALFFSFLPLNPPSHPRPYSPRYSRVQISGDGREGAPITRGGQMGDPTKGVPQARSRLGQRAPERCPGPCPRVGQVGLGKSEGVPTPRLRPPRRARHRSY